MHRYFFVASLCAGLIAASPFNGRGQSVAPAVEVSVGGSKLWEHAAGGPYHNDGVRVAVTSNFNRFLGLEMDLSKFQDILGGAPSPAYADYARFLVGPHFTYRASRRLNPFAHVLLGLTHGRQNCDSLNPPPDCNFGNWERGGNAFTSTIGGGVDVKVSRFFWVRPIQMDYVHASFPNAPENNFQLSFGVTFSFGSAGEPGRHY
jgi:hypothetical protein